MALKKFIETHTAEIVAEWEAFAKKQLPAADTMGSLALRDHAQQIIEAIAQDIGTAQTDAEQTAKSKGEVEGFQAAHTAAAAHGALRLMSGFDLRQLVAEFRALRATVLRLWADEAGSLQSHTVQQVTRFNEAVDQALAESVTTYSCELFKSRDTLVAVLGHDMGRPLSALESRVSLLSQPSGDPQRSETAAGARSDIASIKAMIRDLLEYTGTRLGKGVPVNPTPSDLGVVCKNALNDVSVIYPQASFRFESGGDLGGVFDTARLHQVVANLLNNAVEYGDKGAAISLVAQAKEGKLTVEVKNQGKRLREEVLQALFDPLEHAQLEGSDKRRSASLGLGLFVAREVIKAHGGTISATSSPTGTTFAFEIPRAAKALVDDQAEKKELDHAH